jgi:hypothetical protein
MKVILVFKDRDEQMKKSEYHLSLSLFFSIFIFLKLLMRAWFYRTLFLPNSRGKRKDFFVPWAKDRFLRHKGEKTNTNLINNHLRGDPVVRVLDQEVCFLCGLRFEPCGCSYDGHWRFTWSLTSGPVGLIEVRASWSEHPR